MAVTKVLDYVSLKSLLSYPTFVPISKKEGIARRPCNIYLRLFWRNEGFYQVDISSSRKKDEKKTKNAILSWPGVKCNRTEGWL